MSHEQQIVLHMLSSLSPTSILTLLNDATPKRNLRCRDTLFQTDGGANRSFTNDPNMLDAYWKIDPIRVQGVSKVIFVQCTHRGIYNMPAPSNSFTPVIMCFSPQSTHAIISPNDIAHNNKNFTTCTQVSNFETGEGHAKFSSPSGLVSGTVRLQKLKNFWFVSAPRCGRSHFDSNDFKDCVNSLRSDINYKLWHHRLAHPGQHALSHTHKACDGAPSLHIPNFFSCDSCNEVKLNKSLKRNKPSSRTCRPGELFQMDFGFIRGKLANEDKRTSVSEGVADLQHSDDYAPLKTCRHGYNFYLLIADSATRYSWAFPLASKKPPLAIIDNFLDRCGKKGGSARADLGGELARIVEYLKLMCKHEHMLETTAPDSIFQNGCAERQHRTLAAMMKSMLLGIGLDSLFWSDAL